MQFTQDIRIIQTEVIIILIFCQSHPKTLKYFSKLCDLFGIYFPCETKEFYILVSIWV